LQRVILQRIVQGIIALFLLSILVFALSRATGNPVDLMLDPFASAEERAAASHVLGLDKPIYEQYWIFVTHAVRLDFGKSITQNIPVTDLYLHRFPNTLKLAACAAAFMILGSIPIGLVAALKRGSFIDTLVRLLASLGIAMPMFWLGLILIQIFSVYVHWLPPGGMGGISYYVLPTITLGVCFLAGISRLLRSSMLEVLDTEYIKMLRIKGIPEWKIVVQHALKNAFIAPMTFMGQYIGLILGGAVVVEVVFAWPGVGRLAYDAIVRLDYPVIQGVVLINAAILIVANLTVDILYAYIDPRIRQR
jgi:ABC-type dipeptide/oligopeptide/nickel transport system permease component